MVSTGGRNPSIDAEACARRKIALCAAHGTASSNSATAEVAWALLLALTKRIPQSEKALRAGGWQETVITESLAGKTLGVLGLGRLGKYVARYGQAFGMNVIAWSPHLTDERAAEASVRRVAKEALFAESDVVSVHMVSNAATRGIVGAAEIAAMKPTAYLVNTSRGPLIDEQALIERAAGDDGSRARGSTCSGPSRCRKITSCGDSTTWCSRRISVTSSTKI